MARMFNGRTETMENYKIRNCKKHGEILQRKDSAGHWRCPKCSSERVAKSRMRTKLKAVEYLGGKCCICGYNKSVCALEFHHIDPNKKEFQIGSGRCVNWEKVKEELKKCVLVCANCHREIHEKENKKI